MICWHLENNQVIKKDFMNPYIKRHKSMSYLSPYTHHLRRQDNHHTPIQKQALTRHLQNRQTFLQFVPRSIQQTDLRWSLLSSCILTSEEKDQDHTQMIPYNSKTLSHSQYQLSMLITFSGNQRRPERSESSKFSLSISMTKYKLCKALQNKIKRKSKTS